MGNPNCKQCEMDTLHKGCPVLPCGRYIKPYIAAPKGVIKAVETWQLIVPPKYKNTKKIPKKIVKAIRAHLIENFGGDTEVKGAGSWKVGQRVDFEPNLKIEIDVFASDHDKAQGYMAEGKRILKKYLKQDKIYVTYSISRFEFLLIYEFFDEIGLEKLPDKIPESLDQLEIDLYRTLALKSPDELKR